MRTLLLPAVLLTALLASGCDLIAGIAGAPSEVDVSTGAAGQLALSPDALTLTSANVDVGRSLPDLFTVDQITLPNGAVTFTPATTAAPTGTAAAGAAAVCTINLGVFVDGVRAAEGAVTVDVQGTTGTVTAATLQFANNHNATTICSAFPSGECPAASGTYTRAQIEQHVTEAIQSGRFLLNIAADNPGDCAGVLAIQQLRFGLDY